MSSNNIIVDRGLNPNTNEMEDFHYRKGRHLGKGGFGDVYECTVLETNKVYAIKIIEKARLGEKGMAFASEEIKINRSILHNNICRHKHSFQDSSNIYMILELCEKQSLSEVVRRRTRLTEPEVMYYMKQLVEAIKYLHDNSILHLDLKLSNIFLDKDLNVKLGDFGLARHLKSSDELVTSFAGTLPYMAPEIVNRSGHSFKADIWAIGVILY